MAVCPEKCGFCEPGKSDGMGEAFSVFPDESRPFFRWIKDVERQLSIRCGSEPRT
jgi:hypothetical protein